MIVSHARLSFIYSPRTLTITSIRSSASRFYSTVQSHPQFNPQPPIETSLQVTDPLLIYRAKVANGELEQDEEQLRALIQVSFNFFLIVAYQRTSIRSFISFFDLYFSLSLPFFSYGIYREHFKTILLQLIYSESSTINLLINLHLQIQKLNLRLSQNSDERDPATKPLQMIK